MTARLRLRAWGQRLYVHARVLEAHRLRGTLCLGLAAGLVGIVARQPFLLGGGAVLMAFPISLFAIGSAMGTDPGQAERYRFGPVVPDGEGRPAWRQITIYARRRSTRDSHALWGTALGTILLLMGIFIPGAYDTHDAPRWFLPAMGLAALAAPWLLELLGAAIMREPADVHWDEVWRRHVVDPGAERAPWGFPSFWLLVAMLVAAVVGFVSSL